MSTFQIVMLSLAGLLTVSAFWEQIKTAINNVKPDPKPPTPIAPPAVVVDNGGNRHECDEDSLCSLVVCWENLRDELNERGLYQAEQEVEKIFPLFVKDSQPLPQPAPVPPQPAPAPVTPPNQPAG